MTSSQTLTRRRRLLPLAFALIVLVELADRRHVAAASFSESSDTFTAPDRSFVFSGQGVAPASAKPEIITPKSCRDQGGTFSVQEGRRSCSTETVQYELRATPRVEDAPDETLDGQTGYDLSGGQVQRGEQSGDPVPLVVLGATLDLTRSHRQRRLGPIKSLDAGLLVDTHHCGM